MAWIRNQYGVSIIAAIFIIIIIAFMGVMFVTMIGTGSFSALNELESAQALSIAEGGVAFHQRGLAVNLDWYRSAADPISTDTLPLGAGSFTVSTNLPATKLSRRIRAGDATMRVYSTDRFPNAGFLQVEDNVASGAEFVEYTGKTATTFTGLVRGRTIGTVATVAGVHARGSAVYPVATLSAGLASSCTSPASITVSANTKFLNAGIINIEGEEIRYTGSDTSGGLMTLTGVQRCIGSVGPVAHAAGQPVTPLLIGGDTADYQAEIISTGTAGSAVRVMNKVVVR